MKFEKLKELQRKQGNLKKLEVSKGKAIMKRFGLAFSKRYGGAVIVNAEEKLNRL